MIGCKSIFRTTADRYSTGRLLRPLHSPLQRLVGFAIVFVIFLAVALPASAQSNMIRGKVRNTDGTIVNNAIVDLKIGGGAMIAQTVTRNDGDFAFTNLVAGEYEVSVSAAGYDTAAQMVRFEDSGRMNFAQVRTVEVLVRKTRDNSMLGLPGTNFAQEVPRPARASYEKATAKLREGKNDEAVALLREAIENFNDYFDAHFALARELFRQGKDEATLEVLERARQINDRQDAIFQLFGMVMLKQQKFVVAEYAFGQAATINPTSAAAHFYRGVALIEVAVREADERHRTAGLAEAEKELNRAFDISNQRLAAVHFQRARIYERRGDKSAAIKELESFLKADPESKNAASIRAMIVKLREQPAK